MFLPLYLKDEMSIKGNNTRNKICPVKKNPL